MCFNLDEFLLWCLKDASANWCSARYGVFEHEVWSNYLPNSLISTEIGHWGKCSLKPGFERGGSIT